jgi:hypothetical protein
MSDGGQRSDPRERTLDGARLSYRAGEREGAGDLEIAISVGDLDPARFHLTVLINVMRVVERPAAGEQPRTVREFNLGFGAWFERKAISTAGERREDGENLFTVTVGLPDGIRANDDVDGLLAGAGVDLPESLEIPVDEVVVDGGGLDGLQDRAGLTDFETAVVGHLLADVVATTADERGYNFDARLTWGVANAIARMLDAEMAAAGVVQR